MFKKKKKTEVDHVEIGKTEKKNNKYWKRERYKKLAVAKIYAEIEKSDQEIK